MVLRHWLDRLFPVRLRSRRIKARRQKQQWTATESLEIRTLLSGVTFGTVPDAQNPLIGFQFNTSYSGAAVDLDGDGDLDFVSASFGNGDGRIRYYQNTGTTTTPIFTKITGAANPFDGIATSTVASRPDLAFTDLDHDGDVDLVMLSTGKTTNPPKILYYQNVGSATNPSFALQSGSADPFNGLDAGDFPRIAMGDLDGDGNVDLILSPQHDPYQYYKNTGTATHPAFTLQTGAASPVDGLQTEIYSAPTLDDVDSDGDLDMTAADAYGNLFYFENTGSPTSPVFTRRTGSENPFDRILDYGIASLTFADLNADGNQELIAGGNNLNFLLYSQVSTDLQLTQTVSNSTAKLGDTLTFTVTVTNNGPDTATNTQISSFVPGLTNLTITPSLGIYTQGIWRIPSLPSTPGSNTAILTIQGTVGNVPAGTDLISTAEITASIADSDSTPGNHLASEDDQQNLAVHILNSTAPVLNSTVLDMGTVTNGIAFNPGVLVRDLINSAPIDLITDGDVRPLEGIAVSSTISSQGTWQFSLDNGATWTSLGSVSLTSARLLAADDKTRIRLLPDPGASAQDGFTFFAWDQTTGVNGATANLSTRGGSTPFSAASLPVSISVVNSANAAPVLNNTGTATLHAYAPGDTQNRGTSIGELIESMAPSGGITDSPSGLLTRQGIAVTAADTTHGSWQFTTDNGTTWLPLGPVTNASARLLARNDTTRIRFVPTADYRGTILTSLTFRAWDQTSGANGDLASTSINGGSTAFSTAVEYASLTVRATDSYLYTDLYITEPPTLLGDVDSYTSPALADLDGDGDLDMLVSDIIGFLWYYENIGTPASPDFEPRTGSASLFAGIEISGGMGNPTFADLDHDGDFDLVIGSGSGITYVKNVGTPQAPQFALQSDAANPFAALKDFSSSHQNFRSFAPTFVDLDADGDLDFISGNNLGTFLYSENIGTPTDPIFVQRFSTDNPFAGLDAGDESNPRFADLDFDGDSDLFSGTQEGTIVRFRNIGSPTHPIFETQASSDDPPTMRSSGDSAFDFGDLNADGHLDLIVGNSFGRLLPLIAGTSDLSLTQTITQTASPDGNLVTITVTLTNSGTATVSKLLISDPIPAGLTNVTVSTGSNSSGSYANGLWTIDPNLFHFSLAPNSSRSLTITGTITDLSPDSAITNTAEIISATSNDPDSVPNNHQTWEDDFSTLTFVFNHRAPVLNPAGNPALQGISEDTLPEENPGTLVSDIIASMAPGGISDSGPRLGIALDTAPTANGTWQFSLDNGFNWTTISSASPSHALLLAADDKTRVRFLPKANFNGTVSMGFSAWNQASGMNGNYVDATVRGGTTALSAEWESATLVVSPVNDAPILNNAGNPILTAIPRDVPSAQNVGTPVSALITSMTSLGGISDVDAPAAFGIAITFADNAHGSWEFSTNGGTNWNLLGTPSASAARLLASDPAATLLRFLPASGYTGTAAISFVAWDQSAGSNGATADVSLAGGTSPFSTAQDSASITVFGTTSNHAPTAIGKSSITWPAENVPFAPIATLSATDQDSGNTFVYTISPGADGSQFTISGNKLLVGAVGLNYEAGNQRVVILRATDQNGTYVESSFVVTVIDANEAPTDIVLSNDTVPENAPNQLIGLLSTTDPDSGNTFTYSIVPGGASSFFTLTGNQLSVGSTGFDFDAATARSVTIRAKDQSGLTFDKTFTIKATNVNESPTGLILSKSSVVENAPGANVGQLSTLDPDAADTFIYSILPGGDGSQFSITGSQLFATVGFDFESVRTKTLSIRTTDSNGQFFDRTFLINIIDVNDAPQLRNTANLSLGTVQTAVANNRGVLIGDLIRGETYDLITDADSRFGEGIAIYSATTTQGTWQFSIDDGAHWTDLGSVSTSSARLLSTDERTRIRLVATPGANGQDQFQFYAWDLSSGANGALADATTRGGTSPFSIGSLPVKVTVTSSNTAPILTSGPSLQLRSQITNDPLSDGTLIDDLIANLLPPSGGVSDTAGLYTAKGIAVTAVNASLGTWQFSLDNGKTWQNLGTVSQTSARLLAADGLTRVRWLAPADYIGVLPQALTFCAWDQTTGINAGTANASVRGGTTAFSAATATASLTLKTYASYIQATGSDNPFDGVDLGTSSRPTFIDLDGDGDLDLVAGSDTGKLVYFKQSGPATHPVFTAQAGVDNPFSGFAVINGISPDFADLDHDGDLDLIVGTSAGTFQYFENIGSATSPIFSPRTGDKNPFDGLTTIQNSRPTFVDLDGDQDIDMVSPSSGGSFNFFENTGTADRPNFVKIPYGSNPFYNATGILSQRPAFADIDGDGDLDAITGGVSGYFKYIKNTGTPADLDFFGTFISTDTIPFRNVAPDLKYTSPALIDIDGDGDLDIVTGDAYGMLTVYKASYSDLQLTQTSSSPTIQAGQQITFTVTVQNNGPDAASAITIANAVSKYLSNVTVTPSVGTYANSIWTIPALSATSGSNTATLTITGTVSTISSATLVNKAEITQAPSDLDSIPGNNLATEDDQNSLAVQILNTAPVLDPAGSPKLSFVNEDSTAANIIGTSVNTIISSLISTGGNYTDPDTFNGKGIAVTGLDQSNGVWQFSTDAGTNWSPLGTPTPSAARLLTSNSNTRLRFIPNPNFSGTATFTFVAWDQTTGANGGVADASVGGGMQAFSLLSETAIVTVNPINDPPIGSDKTITILEDTSYVFKISDFPLTDSIDSPPNSLLAVILTSSPTAGTLIKNGTPIGIGSSVLASDITAGLLKFTPATNANGTAYASFNFKVKDNGGSSDGGIDVAPIANTFTINVFTVNDPPSGTDKTVAISEGKPYVFSSLDFGFTDLNDTPQNSFATVKITTLPTVGTLTLNGNPVPAGMVISALSIPGLKFVPPSNLSGAESTSFTFQVRDTGGTSNAGIDLDPTPNTFTFSINPVNHPPESADRTVVTAEDTDYLISNTDFAFTDPIDLPQNTFQGIKITTLPTKGTVTVNGVAVTAGQYITLADFGSSTFLYHPNADINGTKIDSFTFQVWDNGGTANGGIDLDTTPDTLFITVAPRNDAPILNPAGNATLDSIMENVDIQNNLGTTTAQIIANLTLTGGGITEIDNSSLRGIAVTRVDQTNGTWQYTIDNGTNWLNFGTPTPTAARLIGVESNSRMRFIPNADFNGTATFEFVAWDCTKGALGDVGDATKQGGINPFSLNSATGSITVISLNNAPVLKPQGSPVLDSISEDPTNNPGTLVTQIIASMAPLGKITDADSSDPQGLAVIDAVQTSGTWQFTTNGTTWKNFGTTGVTNALLLAADSKTRIRFVPNANFNGSASLTFLAWDQTTGTNGLFTPISTTGGTSAFSTARDTAGISVTSVNDAPVLNPAGDPALASIAEDAAANPGTLVSQIIAGMSPNGGISDADSGAGQGLAIIGANQLSGTWQFTLDGNTWTNFGTTSAANALLLSSDATTKIRFVPKPNFNGSSGFTFIAWDQTTGSNGAFASIPTVGGTSAFSTGKDSAFINVTPVNDAPVLNAAGDPALTSISEDTLTNTGTPVSTLIASMAPKGSITDVDASAKQGIAVIGANQTAGTWQFATDGTTWNNFGATGITSALLLASNADTRIRFVPLPNFNGSAGLTFIAWDQSTGTNGLKTSISATGGTSSFSSGKDNAFITVTPVNDAPLLNPNGNPALSSIPKNVLTSNNTGTLVSQLITSMSPGGSIIDVDAGAQRGIAIIGANQVSGTWQFSTNGTTWSNFGTTSAGNALLLAADATTRIRFLPNSNFTGTVGFTFVAWDQTAGSNGLFTPISATGGTTAFSSARDNAFISVT